MSVARRSLSAARLRARVAHAAGEAARDGRGHRAGHVPARVQEAAHVRSGGRGTTIDVDPDDRGTAIDRRAAADGPAPAADVVREAANRADDRARSREIASAI